MADNYVSVEQLVEAGAHFGHLTRRWNPKMNKYIFGERNGIHIIDVRKTQILINHCRGIIQNLASQGKNILYVGTKTQAKDIVVEHATRAGINYVSERWLGGMLTNFSTIRKSIRRLSSIDKMEADGTFEKITKKERLLLTREKDRLRKVFGGIENMQKLPSAIFVVDAKKEHLAVKEARILGISVFGIIDTNTDPDSVDFPIPANDDSVKAIDIIMGIMTDAIIEGSEIYRVHAAELAAMQSRNEKENEGENAVEVKQTSHRRMRERRERDRNHDNHKRTDKHRDNQRQETTKVEEKKQEVTQEVTQEVPQEITQEVPKKEEKVVNDDSTNVTE